MLAFEIHLNGKRLCTAGIGEPGVVTSIITWVLGERTGSGKKPWDLGLTVGGLVSRTEEHVNWARRSLRTGDEVSIRIVEVEDSDKPRERRREDPAKKQRQKKAYVRKLAKEFGWKIETRPDRRTTTPKQTKRK